VSFRKATILVAILATLLIASTPLVLAQQQEGIPPPGGEAAPGVFNEGTGYASPEDAGTTAGTLVSPGGISPNDSGALQYDTAPDPVVPPGYQKVGDSYCPTFDPHGPPCFRVP
jgi:hypothetical protein